MASLASADWSVRASPNLATKPPTKEAVNRFLRSLVESYGETGGSICSFRFADLQHDGNFSLVAGVDVSGRMLCDSVYIINRTPSGFEAYLTGGEGTGDDVASDVVDLQRDGKFEYVLGIDIGLLKGQCYAQWPVIYAWSNGGYRNVSDRFKDFYRQHLASLNKTISAIPPKRHPYDRSARECLLAEAAKIQRFLGISPDAGLDQAFRLANSKDPTERQFAADLLGGIGSPKARKYLEILAKDSDRDVADEARYYLSGPSSKGPIRPPDELSRDPVG